MKSKVETPFGWLWATMVHEQLIFYDVLILIVFVCVFIYGACDSDQG